MAPEVSIADKGMMQILKETFKENFFYYQGRASRREYWLFQLAILIASFVFGMIIGLFIGILSIALGVEIEEGSMVTMLPSILIMLVIIIPSVCLGIRRLHDVGYTGWLILLSLIPFLNLIILVFYVMPSKEGTNKYGPNPYGIGDSKDFKEEKLKENPAFNASVVKPDDKTSKIDPNTPNYKA